MFFDSISYINTDTETSFLIHCHMARFLSYIVIIVEIQFIVVIFLLKRTHKNAVFTWYEKKRHIKRNKTHYNYIDKSTRELRHIKNNNNNPTLYNKATSKNKGDIVIFCVTNTMIYVFFFFIIVVVVVVDIVVVY